jgi:hypothetical protein
MARAFPSLSTYSAAVLAGELVTIERAQRRHAERCCSGADGGYVRVQLDKRATACGTDVLVHDQDAEDRAGKRIYKRALAWRERIIAHHDQRGGTLYKTSDIDVHLHGDPRGCVLTVRLPGEGGA